jgi:hypothetical protein
LTTDGKLYATEFEALLVGQRHRVEIRHDDPIALQPCQLMERGAI